MTKPSNSEQEDNAMGDGKHTAGEWVYLDIGEVVVPGDIEVTIATIDYGRERAEEDGALIAAAPNLLAAAKDVLDWMNRLPIPTTGCTAKGQLLFDAISKAEGHTP